MKISISFSFCALVCLLGWVEPFVCGAFLLAVLTHELGHILALKLWRIRIRSVCFSVCGAQIATEWMSYGLEVFCAAAGPVAGVVAGAIMVRRLPAFSMISFGLSIMNMIPLYPLDGGRILRSVLLAMLPQEQGEKMMRRITASTCIILMLLACWIVIDFQAGVWPIFAALALLWKAGGTENSCFSLGQRIEWKNKNIKDKENEL